MKLLIVRLCLLLPCMIFAQSSSEEINLKKYWRYKERLKNHVVPGEGPGMSLISTKRLYGPDYVDYPTVINEGHLNYPDETINLGHYIGTLATEYGLLLSHGELAQAANTKEELWYALETLNRLDKTAEGWWRYYHEGGSSNPVFEI
ncbi:MAG: hypothetical protein M3R27_08870 [Bacteroidota bacterium]|nr:hypothetical protein [Bacteroidota bacterium]